jgi:murein DD-endopeptidase MepM/ murein hydrolase activator NlpD
VCRYRNNAKREGLFIIRVEDTDANAGATSTDYTTISENVANSLSGLFDGVVGAVSSVAGFLGFSEKSNFSTPRHLKMTSKQQNALGIVVRKLLCPDATKFTSKFGMRIHPKTGAKKFHGGCDFACSPRGKKGSAITTPAGGVVKRAYRDWTGNEKQVWKEKGGNQVVVDHLDGKKSYFLHLKDVKVSLNQTVGQGDTIGTMGNTGIGTNAHLHYTVKEHGTAVDPIPQLLKWFGDVNALGTDQGAQGQPLAERMNQTTENPESEDVAFMNEAITGDPNANL